VELMDGPRSPLFKRFRELCVKTYMELRRQRHKVILLVEMVANGNEHLPCFGGKPQVSPTLCIPAYS
jgi:phosphatidylinositol 4-kinase